MNHIFLFGEKYSFSSDISNYGNLGTTISFIIPQHGDFNCPCVGCRVYRAVNAVESVYNVKLHEGKSDSTYSVEMQDTAWNAAGILGINLPLVA